MAGLADGSWLSAALAVSVGLVLACLEGLGRWRASAPARPASRPKSSPPARRRAVRSALGWTVIFGLVGVGLWAQLGRRAAPEAAPLAAPASAPEDAEALAELSRHVAAHPGEVDASVRLAHLLLRAQRLQEAREVNDRVLVMAPQNLEARVHDAVLAAGAGHGEAARQRLADLCGEAPGFAEAWFFRGMLSLEAQDLAGARQSFERFVATAPDGPQKERIRAMMAGLPP